MNGGTEQSGEGHSPSQVVRNGLIACTLGYAFVAIAPVIVASSEVHGTAIAFWRSWIDFSLIGLVCIFRKKMTKEMFIKCAPAGICFGASIGLYFWAAQMTSIINASLIVVLQPILFVVAAYFIFSEAFTKTDAAFTAVSYTHLTLPTKA